MGKKVLQGLFVVFVGVAVAAAVGAGVVISEAPAFHAQASCTIPFVSRSLESNAQRVGEDLRRHAAAPVDAKLLVVLLGGASLEIQTVLPGNGTHPFGKG